MVHVWDRNDISCNQYIGSLGPETVIRHSSVDNEDSNGNDLVSKSIKIASLPDLEMMNQSFLKTIIFAWESS